MQKRKPQIEKKEGNSLEKGKRARRARTKCGGAEKERKNEMRKSHKGRFPGVK